MKCCTTQNASLAECSPLKESVKISGATSVNHMSKTKVDEILAAGGQIFKITTVDEFNKSAFLIDEDGYYLNTNMKHEQ